MSLDMEAALTKFMCDNADVFSWKPSDMPDIPCEIVKHRLNIKVDAKPMQQRLYCFDEEKRKAIDEELTTLLDASFIRDV